MKSRINENWIHCGNKIHVENKITNINDRSYINFMKLILHRYLTVSNIIPIEIVYGTEIFPIA